MRTEYFLKCYKNSRDPDLIKVLQLYTQNIEPALRTDSKEIIYWIDRYNKKFEDSFFILGFYLNGVIIGFCELAYFLKEKIIIVDYLVIDKQYRRNNTFYEFLDHIQKFIVDENLVFDYIVAEIGYFREKLEPPEKSKLIIRLLKISQFGVVKCSYYIPQLGIDNYESEMKGVMMLYSTNESKLIKKETFLQIVNTIYFKYHLRWYEAFLPHNTKIQYSRILHKLMERIEADLENKKFIEINGLNNLFSTQTSGKKRFLKNKILKVVVGLALLLVNVTIVGGVYLFLKSKFGIEAPEMSAIFYISLFVALFLFTTLFEKKSKVISKLVEKIIDL